MPDHVAEYNLTAYAYLFGRGHSYVSPPHIVRRGELISISDADGMIEPWVSGKVWDGYALSSAGPGELVEISWFVGDHNA